MNSFKITVARVEAAVPGEDDAQVRITFAIDRAPIGFCVPVPLRTEDFDDTEMIEAARDVLHRIFVDLAAQTRDWKLTVRELEQLSSMSLRPKALSS
jgi:hypothetical protein